MEHVHVRREERRGWNWEGMVVGGTMLVWRSMLMGKRWRRGKACASTTIKTTWCSVGAVEVWDS